jgi:hypothetical protein
MEKAESEMALPFLKLFVIKIHVDFIFLRGYIPSMAWQVEYTDEFGDWWDTLNEEEQVDVDAIVGLLEEKGPNLPYPYSSDVKGSKYVSIRELRIQHKGAPYRILYAFDPRRTAVLLIGGKKGGDDRWYDKYVPLAEKIYEDHIKSLKNEQGDE